MLPAAMHMIGVNISFPTAKCILITNLTYDDSMMRLVTVLIATPKRSELDKFLQ